MRRTLLAHLVAEGNLLAAADIRQAAGFVLLAGVADRNSAGVAARSLPVVAGPLDKVAGRIAAAELRNPAAAGVAADTVLAEGSLVAGRIPGVVRSLAEEAAAVVRRMGGIDCLVGSGRMSLVEV